MMNEQLKSYGIFRLEKLKSIGEVRRSLMHVFREQETPNADSSKYHLNQNLIAKYVKDSDSALARLRARLERMSKSPRKNAVLAVEAVFTASPEAMLQLAVEQRIRYFRDCVRWVGKFVGAESIITAQVHRCETTDHLHVIFSPIPQGDNSLNFRKLFGGNKHRLSQIQDQFHQEVAGKYGLDRGVKGSRATHQSLTEYNSLVNHSLPELRAEKHELERQCNDLNKKILRGRQLLDAITSDIKKAVVEHSNTVRYCLTALKERLMDRWGMIYEGNNQFKREADEFIEEVEDKPKREHPVPRRRM
ncbi:MobV family relaxase [Lacimicrobium alkaliphilum]|uniref:Plasmid recombination enzyme n=1 Tax=Lacimicrobium alkaliphilum TaxID=1526571 RepID=A0A0U2ZH86_9ALTE|nr:MobV family relaxase [Lacimicrobium alkaliphilum]ALS97788.1 hypothetical protein AT746_05535 [Lacimicrobium alkaliphilum]